MNKRYFVMVMALLLLTTLGMSKIQGATDMVQNPEQNSKSLSYRLFHLGEKYDCFFTFEEASEGDEPRNSMEAKRVQRLPKKENLQQELEQLRQVVPNFTYEIDHTNPKVVHVIDSRLAQHQHYGLEKTVKNLDFKGNLVDLVMAIANQGVSIVPKQSFLIGGGEFPDRTTEVEVKAEGMKVRDILSNFVTLEGRLSRVLWIARTKLGKEEPTDVYYPFASKIKY